MTGMHGGSTEDEAQVETVLDWISKFRAAGTTTVYARAFRRAEAFVQGLGHKALPMDAWVFREISDGAGGPLRGSQVDAGKYRCGVRSGEILSRTSGFD
jgi:hypothetical protein